ncbi:hypothetical protein AVEN_248867-1 [Araneus ventricosus]|uniref:Uncharacterized protein n=1 Tax=Araneus ventricosus TaxID=182803 RepID=A0A4Y2SCV7_ARAVE|nr:hypothetical protein AVEN_248867-1 [Araneus ventricosus]
MGMQSQFASGFPTEFAQCAGGRDSLPLYCEDTEESQGGDTPAAVSPSVMQEVGRSEAHVILRHSTFVWKKIQIFKMEGTISQIANILGYFGANTKIRSLRKGNLQRLCQSGASTDVLMLFYKCIAGIRSFKQRAEENSL